jgi:hypothetical protein
VTAVIVVDGGNGHCGLMGGMWWVVVVHCGWSWVAVGGRGALWSWRGMSWWCDSSGSHRRGSGGAVVLVLCRVWCGASDGRRPCL